MELYSVWVFQIHHPSLSGDGVKASVIATSRDAAVGLLEEFFFFDQTELNGFLFEPIDLYSIELPGGFVPEVREIVIEDRFGQQWTKLI